MILDFVRIMTSRSILQHPRTVSETVATVRSWFRSPRVRVVDSGSGHADLLFGLLEKLGTAGNLTTDAHLAALAIEYQAEIATTDTDFARFPRLRWFNPAVDFRLE